MVLAPGTRYSSYVRKDEKTKTNEKCTWKSENKPITITTQFSTAAACLMMTILVILKINRAPLQTTNYSLDWTEHRITEKLKNWQDLLRPAARLRFGGASTTTLFTL